MITRIEVLINTPLCRVECFQHTLSVLEFWVPITSLDEHGYVPAATLRHRVKHLLKENLGVFSYITV